MLATENLRSADKGAGWEAVSTQCRCRSKKAPFFCVSPQSINTICSRSSFRYPITTSVTPSPDAILPNTPAPSEQHSTTRHLVPPNLPDSSTGFPWSSCIYLNIFTSEDRKGTSSITGKIQPIILSRLLVKIFPRITTFTFSNGQVL